MLGTFQQSSLRIEMMASEQVLYDCLVKPSYFCVWLAPQRFSSGLPEELTEGTTFLSWLGPIAIHHQVEQVASNHLRLILSQGVDGFHDWQWGDGWVQSRIEGISLLPIHLSQTFGLLRLKQFLPHAGKQSVRS